MRHTLQYPAERLTSIMCPSPVNLRSLKAGEQQPVLPGMAPHMLEDAEKSWAESTVDRIEFERRRPGTGGSSGGILSRSQLLYWHLPARH